MNDRAPGRAPMHVAAASTPMAVTAAPVRPLALGGDPSVPHGAEEWRLRGIPLRLVVFGVAMFVVGAALLVVWADLLADPASYGDTRALALTHVVALGFATSVVMGVLYQFIPASFHANVRGVRRAATVTLSYPAAVVMFTVALGTHRLWVAAIAGPLLAVAVALFLSQMASVVVRARRRTAEGGFHITAFIALSAVIILGALLATSLPTAWFGDPHTVLMAKIVLAIGGWLGMILMGVAYHTVRGLNASRARPRLVAPALVTGVAAVITTPLALVLGAPAAVRAAAAALFVATTLLSFTDVLRLVRARGPGAAPVTWIGQLICSILIVACAVEGVIAMSGGVRWTAAAVTLFLLGVVPVAIVANGNRIVPVLIVNASMKPDRRPLSATGAGRVLVPGAFVVLIASVSAIQVGVLVGNAVMIRAGAILVLAGAAQFAAAVASRVGGAIRGGR